MGQATNAARGLQDQFPWRDWVDVLAAIARSTSAARTLKCSENLVNKSRSALSVVKSRISSQSATCAWSCSRCVCMSSRSISRRAHCAAAISRANFVEQYTIRWSSMLMNISFQREGGLTDIGRFRGRGTNCGTSNFRWCLGADGTPAFGKRRKQPASAQTVCLTSNQRRVVNCSPPRRCSQFARSSSGRSNSASG